MLPDEQVNQRLHGLHFLVGNKLIVLRDSNEMDKAHVKDVMLIDMPKRIQPVGMVDVGIATKHLLHNPLAVLVESLWEAT